MYFYIDPGTGSMLFTILIGVLSAGVLAALWSLWTNRRSVRAWAIFSGVSLALLHLV